MNVGLEIRGRSAGSSHGFERIGLERGFRCRRSENRDRQKRGNELLPKVHSAQLVRLFATLRHVGGVGMAAGAWVILVLGQEGE